MLILKKPPMLYHQIRCWRQEGKRIALVPTMGNLHNGHITLVDEARQRADIVVVSIFVNPMQFERIDDLAQYPRTLQQDCEKLKYHGVDLLFCPSFSDIYPHGFEKQTFVEVPVLSTLLEGASRPKHFRGVLTIVSKLFNLIQPDLSCFGEKDYQQLVLIRKMVEDMGYNIDIVSVPTVRAIDGLAISSRNGYLSSDERKIAPLLNKIMHTIATRLGNGEYELKKMILTAEEELSSHGMEADGLAIVDADTLLPLNENSQRAVVLMAAWLGKTRLIDNQQVYLKTQVATTNWILPP